MVQARRGIVVLAGDSALVHADRRGPQGRAGRPSKRQAVRLMYWPVLAGGGLGGGALVTSAWICACCVCCCHCATLLWLIVEAPPLGIRMPIGISFQKSRSTEWAKPSLPCPRLVGRSEAKADLLTRSLQNNRFMTLRVLRCP